MCVAKNDLLTKCFVLLKGIEIKLECHIKISFIAFCYSNLPRRSD